MKIKFLGKGNKFPKKKSVYKIKFFKIFHHYFKTNKTKKKQKTKKKFSNGLCATTLKKNKKKIHFFLEQ